MCASSSSRPLAQLDDRLARYRGFCDNRRDALDAASTRRRRRGTTAKEVR